MKQEDRENEAPMSENPPEENHETSSSAGSAEAKKRRDRRIRYVLFALLFLLIGLIAGWVAGACTVDSRARNLAWLVEVVEDNYYKEVDDEKLYDALYSALELDKFCSYYNEEEYDRLVSESKGQNVGYGISIFSGERAQVYRTVYNSPAELAGLEGGMYIYRFGGSEEELKAGTGEELFDYLSTHATCCMEFGKSEDEKKVATLTASDYAAAYCEYRDSEGSYRFRDGDKTPVLTRVGEGMAIDEDTAYIRLTQFDGNAGREFTQCLEMMKERGKKNLVLDLRGNGGGYLTTLCSISSHLMRSAADKNPLVATARYRSGKEERYLADGNDFSTYFSADSRIRVLADENTASASESLIGVMMDYGTVTADDIYLRESEYEGEKVGKTYGKGVMQNTFVAPNGRALRLTVAEIFWPKGNSIHDVGVRAMDDLHKIQADTTASAEEFLALLNG